LFKANVHTILGPPDLCHITWLVSSGLLRASQSELGEYHFVHGVDVSSAARVVAYFRTLQAARPVRVLAVRDNVTMIVGPLFAVVVWLAVAN
jgi:hypothetical protein